MDLTKQSTPSLAHSCYPRYFGDAFKMSTVGTYLGDEIHYAIANTLVAEFESLSEIKWHTQQTARE
jgi:hypothetical protein